LSARIVSWARIDDYMWTLHSSILAEVMVVIDDSKESAGLCHRCVTEGRWIQWRRCGHLHGSTFEKMDCSTAPGPSVSELVSASDSVNPWFRAFSEGKSSGLLDHL
jgi:hypothetical protein